MSEADAAAPRGIDPRGPRFAAGITALLLLVAVFLSLRIPGGGDVTSFGWFAYQPLSDEIFSPGGDFAFVAGTTSPLLWRMRQPAFLLLAMIALLFLWGVAWPRTTPWGVLFRRVVQPRLSPPTEREDPRPPRFAQGVGLVVVTVGLVLYPLGVPWALTVAAAAAFVAAFLNAVSGVCLGCMLYLLLARWGLVGRTRAA